SRLQMGRPAVGPFRKTQISMQAQVLPCAESCKKRAKLYRRKTRGLSGDPSDDRESFTRSGKYCHIKPAKVVISLYFLVQTTCGVPNASHLSKWGCCMHYLHVNQAELPLANKPPVAEELTDVTLQVQLGPWLGRKIRVPVGHSVKVGRGSQSDIAFANDAYMSRTHFSLEWDDTACW